MQRLAPMLFLALLIVADDSVAQQKVEMSTESKLSAQGPRRHRTAFGCHRGTEYGGDMPLTEPLVERAARLTRDKVAAWAVRYDQVR